VAVDDALSDTIRVEWPRVVARLVADFGDLSLAEDATQDAVEQALKTWPDKLPNKPGAWLMVAARRRAIDRMRRESRGRDKVESAARMGDRSPSTDITDLDDLLDDSLLRDEQLRLIFACCHPALKPEAQMALTLRSVGGLTTSEIAAAFLVPEPTLAQRLVRAKRKIATAGIPFQIPPDSVLLARTERVRDVIYLIFNEGYDRSGGADLTSVNLCNEAIRLGSVLAALSPDDAESAGMLALMLLTHARHDARTDEDGELVLLADQDRTAWHRDLIDRGVAELDRALRLGRAGPLQIQAAIQALHCEAATADDTDWEQIELLYRQLVTMVPTPVVRLNHAVALAMFDHDAGVALLDSPELHADLGDYSHFHAALGQLLADQAPDRAVASLRTAIDLARNEPERRFLERRLAEITSAAR